MSKPITCIWLVNRDGEEAVIAVFLPIKKLDLEAIRKVGE